MGEVFYLINGRGILKGISGILQHQEKKNIENVLETKTAMRRE